MVKIRQANWALPQLVLYLLFLKVPLIRATGILYLLAVAEETLKSTGEALLILFFLELFVSLFPLAPQFLLLGRKSCLHHELELRLLG